MQQVGVPVDPSPSRWAYRLQRLLLTPLFRLLLRVVVPFLAVLALTTIWFSDQARRDQLTLALADLRASIEERPEFRVGAMAIYGASESVAADIREVVPLDFPISSFDLNLEDIRARILELAPVASAKVRVRSGVLRVRVTERVPVALWRNRDGLDLLDIEGIALAEAESVSVHPDLPLIAGEGAEAHVPQALALLSAAAPLGARLKGLVRIGARRWDVVLDRDQRILLPEYRPVQALERVIALHQAQDMLARDLSVVDMRVSARPTIRMSAAAVEEWWRLRQIAVEVVGQ